MKVGIVLNFPPNDHRAVFYDGFVRELIKIGDYDINIIMQKGEIQFEDVPYKLTLVPGGTYSKRGQLEFMYHTIKEIRKNNYDVIHARNPFSSLIPPLLAKTDAKIIYDVRGLWAEFGVNAGYYSKWTGRILDSIDVKLAKMCDAIIAISPLMKKILMKKGIHKGVIEIVPEGVDIEKFSKAKPIDLHEKFGIDGKIIGYVGSISLSRGSNKIIEAFRLVKDEIEDAFLVMVGLIKDEEKRSFRELVKRLKLEDSIIFTGSISHSNVPSFVKSFDVAVSYFPFNHPIYDVAVPIKILEYIAAGVPVVATDNLSHKNIIKDGVNGYLSKHDIGSLSRILIKTLKYRKKLCMNSLSINSFSFHEISRKINYLYLDILSS